MSSFDPMPDLIAQEDNFTSNSDTMDMNQFDSFGEANKMDDEMSVETKTQSRTHFVNWVIDNRSLHIAKLAPKGDKRGVIEANVEKDGHRFKLELCASGWRNSQDGYCAFYLTVADQDDLFVARYRVQVGDITRISSIRHDFHLGVGFPNFCQQETLENIMSNNTVRFLVTVEVFTSSSEVKPPTRPLSISPIQQPSCVLAGLMNDMYRDRLHSDVTVLCQGLRIPAHKCVLAHASPVFRSMFAHNMIENSTNQVRMHDWDPQIVYTMIQFLYTAKIADNNLDLKSGMDVDNDDDLCSLSFGNATPSPSPSTLDSNGQASDLDIIPPLNSANFSGATNMSVNVSYPQNEDIQGLDVDMADTGDNTTEAKNQAQSVSPFALANDPDATKLRRCRTFKLFQLAEFYKIQSLVIACCEKLHRELTVSSACDLLVRIQRYAHVPEIRAIKDSIWKFVTLNIRDIKKSKGFDKLAEEHPDLLLQLVHKMSL